MSTIERNEIFELAFRFITETQESIFLTGKAGTGKTTFLKYLRDNSSKNMIVAAPTGVAAINAGGVTLHSLFQLPLHPFLPTEKGRQQLLQGLRYNKQRTSLLRKMEVLVIDEVSMVRCDTMDAIDSILKSVRRRYSVPFGGVQVLFIGDLYQLPPVARPEDWNLLQAYYASPFFFDSFAVKDQAPLLVELNKIYRQKEESFVALLNKVRNNQLEKEDLHLLNSRYIKQFEPAQDEKYITLTSHNNQSDQINQQKLRKLNTPSFTFKAVIEGDFPENIYPADPNLELKEGAQVMFIKNDPVEKKFFNGKLGVVTKLSADKIIVTSDGRAIELVHEYWENTRYTLNRNTEQLEQNVLGRFSQFPLRLAWAITIHKSQGLTFDKVMIDAAASFSSGQVYVALSRCTSLNGIVLLSRIPPSAISSSEQVANAHDHLTHKGSLAERFSGARHNFTLQLLHEVFLLEDILHSATALQAVVERQADRLNETSVEWMASFLQRLKKEQSIAVKFIHQAQELLLQQSEIENNPAVQQRIQDATAYFFPVVTSIRDELQQHPMVTEHKETAGMVDEVLMETLVAFTKTIHLLQYCHSPFAVSGYLKHKLNLVIPRMHISSYAASKRQIANTDVRNPELYHTLKNWRDQLCEAEDLPIYVVANHQSLVEVCSFLPLNTAQLQLLTGFGRVKAERFGEAIVAIVQDYCNQHGLESNIDARAANPKRVRKERGEHKVEKVRSDSVSLQLFKDGKSIEQIASERGLAKSTVEGHLANYISTGEIAMEQLIDPAKAAHIITLLDGNPDRPYVEVKSIIGDQYSYGEIRVVVNHLKWMQSAEDVAK